MNVNNDHVNYLSLDQVDDVRDVSQRSPNYRLLSQQSRRKVNPDRIYQDMVAHTLDNGFPVEDDRTGEATVRVTGMNYSVSAEASYFPLLTTKKVNFDSIVAELLWFISGQSHIQDLQKHTKIWDAWAEDGRLDTAYGYFWRHFPVNTTFKKMAMPGIMDITGSEHYHHNGETILLDQLHYMRDSIVEKPFSRRHVMTAWYPPNAVMSKLPPCHMTWTVNLRRDRPGVLLLDLHLMQRSGDLGLGIPFNMASYSLLCNLLASDLSGRIDEAVLPGQFHHSISNAHIYRNHIDGLVEQLKRMPERVPTIKTANVHDITNLSLDDVDDIVELSDYQYHEAISLPVAV